jgi:hypothetical protein
VTPVDEDGSFALLRRCIDLGSYGLGLDLVGGQTVRSIKFHVFNYLRNCAYPSFVVAVPVLFEPLVFLSSNILVRRHHPYPLLVASVVGL